MKVEQNKLLHLQASGDNRLNKTLAYQCPDLLGTILFQKYFQTYSNYLNLTLANPGIDLFRACLTSM